MGRGMWWWAGRLVEIVVTEEEKWYGQGFVA